MRRALLSLLLVSVSLASTSCDSDSVLCGAGDGTGCTVDVSCNHNTDSSTSCRDSETLCPCCCYFDTGTDSENPVCVAWNSSFSALDTFPVSYGVTVFVQDFHVSSSLSLEYDTIEKGNTDSLVFGHVTAFGTLTIEPGVSLTLSLALAPTNDTCYSLLDYHAIGGVADDSLNYPREWLAENISFTIAVLFDDAEVTGRLEWDPPLDAELPPGFYDLGSGDALFADCLKDKDNPDSSLVVKERHLVVRFFVVNDRKIVTTIIIILASIAGGVLLILLVVIVFCRPRLKAWWGKRKLPAESKKNRDNPDLDFYAKESSSSPEQSSEDGGGLQM